MRHADLKAVGHNIADSLASGLGFMIGMYHSDVFAEASAAAPGYIDVDFLRGSTSGAPASPSLRIAVALYSQQALPALCARHAVDRSQVAVLRARFDIHPPYGCRFIVTVEDSRGKRSAGHYVGRPGRMMRLRVHRDARGWT